MTWWRAGTAASIWLVLCVSLWMTGSRPAVVALAGVVAVGTVVLLSVVDGTSATNDTGWSHHDMRDSPEDDDQWTIQLRHQLTGARMTGSTELHQRLVSLVKDRRSADQPLSPVLRDLLTGSPRRLNSRRTLELTITHIEAL